MTDTVPFLDRRRLLGLFAGLSVAGRAGIARAGMSAMAAQGFRDNTTILIAGPEGGALDQWGRVVQPALAQTLPPDTSLRRITVGANDGVTGANQFDARTAPDGQTALLVPGEAALAWLVGDPRAQFDVSHWMSVMAVVTPAIVLARPGALRPGNTVRMPVDGPVGLDLPAVLGAELLGAQVTPLPPLDPAAEAAALAQGKVDALFLRGHRVPQRTAALIQAGAQPIFSMGAYDADGKPSRCSAFPDIATLSELYTARGTSPAAPLFIACRAAAVAAQLECALVLPLLTPAGMVAWWRRAGAEAAATLDVQAAALALGVRAIGGPEATATTGAAVVDRTALVALRRWLETRFHWRPS